MKKRCLRCGGNIILSSDEHGWYEHCLQCSYTQDLEVVVESAGEDRPAVKHLRPRKVTIF